jgi:ketosteroid isomerase-like protein
MRSMWIISPIIAIGLVTSASAQGVDQNTKQQIEQIIAAYHDAWNNHSGAGVAALYTKDAILVAQAPQIVKARATRN